MSLRWPAAAVLLLLCACSSPATERRPVAITEARLPDDRTLELGVASCNGEPEVTELVEEDDEVRVEVTSTVSNPGDACLDLVEVELQAPLGDRRLIDLSSGKQVIPAG